MKKRITQILMFTLLLTIALSSSNIAFAQSNELEQAYEDLMIFTDNFNIPLTMTYDEFVHNYNESHYSNVDTYLESYYTLLKPNISTTNAPMRYSSGFGGDTLASVNDQTWYYCTGTSIPANGNPDYSRYHLIETLRPGDIIHEANGGFGITGHTAIVEGIFYSPERDMYYVRIIEAIGRGVVRSILDDTRMDAKDVTVYRLSMSDGHEGKGALQFCLGELGSSYMLDLQKDTSASETDWYCSEVVWAGYMNQGVDIETRDFFNEPGVSPRDIADCHLLHIVHVK